MLTKVHEAHWIRAAFGAFLLVSAMDMARRAMIPHPVHHEHPPHSPAWLGLAGFFGGGTAPVCSGIGGGLIAVPVLLYVGRLPVQAVAPTALAGVCLTTLAGSIGYMTGGAGTAGLTLDGGIPGCPDGAAAGAWCRRAASPWECGSIARSSPSKLFWFFAAVFSVMGILLIKEGLGG